MKDLEILQLSAKVCGHPLAASRVYKGKLLFNGPFDSDIEWNPFTRDDQRWECEEKLLRMKFWILIYNEGGEIIDRKKGSTVLSIICPPKKFHATSLALLEENLWQMKSVRDNS